MVNRPRLAVRFFGLLGPNGPLPLHLTEYALKRLRYRQGSHHDRTFAWFLDIFHHRMLSLFYRAWANNEPTVSFDRPESDRFADYVGSLAGLGMPSLRERDDISDLTKLYYCGWLSSQTKPAEGLQAMLADYFKLQVCIEEFIGEWMTLPEEHLCRIGRITYMDALVKPPLWGHGCGGVSTNSVLHWAHVLYGLSELSCPEATRSDVSLRWCVTTSEMNWPGT